MAARLLGIALLQQMRTLQRQKLFLPQRRNVKFAGVCVKCLHTKIYDKDVQQRNTNNYVTKDNNNNNNKYNNPFTTTTDRYINQMQHLEHVEETVDNDDNDNNDNDDDDVFHGGTPLTTDKDDQAEEEYAQNLPNRRNRLRIIDYARLIKGHLVAKRLGDAINILEQRMLKEDRVKPDKYIYNLLISACAKAGQTSKAFSLFTKMRQRGLDVTGGTYTSLFNACANCANPSYALERVEQLRAIMREKQVEPNVRHYHVMIKAYGRCSNLAMAFTLVDEMLDRKLAPSATTFNFLLQACASDADYGFRHCLLTWHKMLACRIKPDYYSFKTMLRCVRDCNFGDMATMQQVLQDLLANSAQVQLEPKGVSSQPLKLIPHETLAHEAHIEQANSELTVANDYHEQLQVPNLLLPRPHLGSVVALAAVNKPHERFLLLGGISGYMEQMKSCNITPDIEMFTAMLEVVAPTYAAEKQIIGFIRRIGLKADIDFFNVLIKKRSMRFDYEGAKEVLSMVRTAGLHPDIVTYGVLALGCRTPHEAQELLHEMRKHHIRINVQILGAMLRQGCANKNFEYIIEILQLSLEEHITPNDMFLQHLHKFYNQCARAIDARHPYTKSGSFKKGHAKFCDKLRLYYEELGLADMKLEDKLKKINMRERNKPTVEGMEQVKNEKLARQQKTRKYIRKIKINELRNDHDNNDDDLVTGEGEQHMRLETPKVRNT